MSIRHLLIFSLFLGLAMPTQATADDYYFYEGPKGELVITNNQPPPGSKIIKRLPAVTKEAPKSPEPNKPQSKVQMEGSQRSSEPK